MCTLILGVDVAGPETVLAGANRDEDPARPADPPGVLHRAPRVVGGRDRRAGGTWLAVREDRAVIAMLNRRDDGPPDAARRSRGLLALETARVPAPGDTGAPALARAALDHALERIGAGAYAPFSMVFAAPGACWMIAHTPGRPPRAAAIAPGWHVLTHTELDDPMEPRAARLLHGLAGWAPRSLDEGLRGLGDRLRDHAEGRAAVCIHEGRMVTVSSSRVSLGARSARYLHVEGRPCEASEADVTLLLKEDP